MWFVAAVFVKLKKYQYCGKFEDSDIQILTFYNLPSIRGNAYKEIFICIQILNLSLMFVYLILIFAIKEVMAEFHMIRDSVNITETALQPLEGQRNLQIQTTGLHKDTTPCEKL